MSTFSDNTAIFGWSKCPQQAPAQLAAHLDVSEKWLSDWRKQVNEQNCKEVIFTLNRRNCPNLTLNNTVLPQSGEVTYLGEHLDRRLTWRTHIEAKRTHLRLKANSLHWLINSCSPLSLDYKVLLYNSVLKPIWTYEIVQRAQAKILKTITGAPWYVRSGNVQRDLNILPVRDVTAQHMENYYTKLSTHPNHLARALRLVCWYFVFFRKDRPIQQQLLGQSNINTV